MKCIAKILPALLLSLLLLTGCGAASSSSTAATPAPETAAPAPTPDGTEPATPEEPAGSAQDPARMQVEVNGTTFTATLADNAAVDALTGLLEQGPVTIQMQDYSGFEKVGPLGQDLPTENSQTTTSAGDIVLYQGNQIVVFYGSNTWSYTRLGTIDDLTGWEEALGSGDATVTFSLAE